VRHILLLCLSTFRTPLRPQNWNLLVTSKPMSLSQERKILDDYNKTHYANKTEFITGFIFKVLR
jgi:hypothetical protein